MRKIVLLKSVAVLLAVLVGGCLTTSPITRANRALDGKRFEEAASAYGEVVRLEPQKWRMRVRYGYALLRTGKTAEALFQFMETLRYQGHSPDRHWAVFYAGLCEARQGDAGRAVAYWGGYSNIEWTLTKIVRQAAKSLVENPALAGETFALQTLEHMERAQAEQSKHDQRYLLTSPGTTANPDTGDAELQVWDKKTKPYLP